MKAFEIRKRLKLAAVCLSASLLICSCGSNAAEQSTADSEVAVVQTEDSELFTERDEDASYDESKSEKITLEETVTITEGGTYILTGELEDGMVIIDVDDNEKVQLVLDGVTITNASSAAIYVKQADKVFITLAEGSVNTLSNGGTFTDIDENHIDGVIFSKDDLTINGSGSLTIESPAGNGIVCKDDLKITGGIYVITAGEDGLNANDDVRTKNADITIAAGDDGIHAGETLTVVDGTIDVSESYEGLEGLHVNIYGGDITVTASDDGINAAKGSDKTDSTDTPSILIAGGTVQITAYGDGIDANGTIEMSGGYVTVTGPVQGDTATLDYDQTGVITGGTFIGTGAAGMAQTFSDSEQGVISVNVGSAKAGTLITLTDSEGNEVISYTPELPMNVVILSSPEIEKGETYTLTVGENSGEFTAS